MKRKLFISAIISLILLSLFFAYVLNSVKREIENEKARSANYLTSTVETALNIIQDNIFYIYKEISNLSKEVDITRVESQEYLDNYFVVDDKLIKFFPEIMDVCLLKEIDLSEQPINYKPPNEHIHINNFIGEMSFPLPPVENSSIYRYLSFTFDMNTAINDYLPNLVMYLMQKKYDQNSNIKLEVLKGSQVLANKNYYKSDLIIDLSQYYNTKKINEYFVERLERDTLSKINSPIFNSNTYLVINKYIDNIDREYNNKYNTYLLGIIITFLALVSGILSLLFNSYRVYENNLREKDFTSLISHELKTPISVIKLSADNLSSGVITEKEDIQYYGSMIMDETDKLSEMITNILDVSASNKSNNLEMVPLEKIITNIEKKSQNLLNQLNIRMELDNRSTIKKLHCNETTLSAAIFNVIKNAITYGANLSEEKKIIIEIFNGSNKKNVKGVTFRVIDFGPGISKKDSNNIFRPFYRGKNMKELQLSGSGLGLAFSKKVLKNINGDISLVKSLRKGTIFEIWIPDGSIYEKDFTN